MRAELGDLVIRPARAEDLGGIEHLLIDRRLPPAGISEHLADSLVAEKGTELLGCAGIERYGDVGLLRSVAVLESASGRGLGVRLVEAAITRASRVGIQTLYLLTTTAAGYFPRFGFEVIPRTELPAVLNASEELQGACPASATAMRRPLELRGPDLTP